MHGGEKEEERIGGIGGEKIPRGVHLLPRPTLSDEKTECQRTRGDHPALHALRLASARAPCVHCIATLARTSTAVFAQSTLGKGSLTQSVPTMRM